MSIYRVDDYRSDALAAEQYDVGVFSSGYEPRCTFVPRQLRGRKIKNHVVLGFKELAAEKARKENDAYYRDQWGAEPLAVSADNDFAIQRALNDVASRGGRLTRILVDYSSMSRLWYSGVLNWARFGNNADETTIDFAYSVGKYEEQDLPMEIEDMLSIPGCEGGPMRSRDSLAIFGLGFNPWASLSVLERLEADEVFAYIASPGASPDYPHRVRRLNKDFLEEPRVKGNVFELPLRSAETSYRFLSELVIPHRLTDSITLVPMGPKPHVLASILVSMRFPEVSCMRVSVKRKPEKIVPTGEVLAARVTVRGQARKRPGQSTSACT
jgi:hypothetical protein